MTRLESSPIQQAGSTKTPAVTQLQPRENRHEVRSYSGFPTTRSNQTSFAFSQPGDARSEAEAEAVANQIGQQPAGSAGAFMQQMGQTLGHDFSGVRLHADAQAAQKSEAQNARAFTLGTDIYFNRGEYNPQSTEGQSLLAHELTHVAQQDGQAPVVQKEEKTGTEAGKKPEEGQKSALEKFQEFAYEKAKESLDKEKLEGYAQKLAEAASEALINTAKEQNPDAGVTDKAQTLGLALVIQFDLAAAVNDLLNSPGAEKFKTAVLNGIKQDPAAALGAALVGLAALYLSGEEVPIPVGSKFEIAAGLKAKGITDPSLGEAALKVSYVGKEYKLSIGGKLELDEEKKGPQPALDPSGMIVGTKQTSLPSTDVAEPGDEVKIKFGPALDFKSFGLSIGPTFDSSRGWGGQLALRFGDDKSFFKPTVSLGPGGDLKFEVEGQNAFRLKNLNLKAALTYNYNDQVFKNIGINTSFTVRPKRVFDQLYMGVQISGQRVDVTGTPGGYTPFQAQGVLFIGGRFKLGN